MEISRERFPFQRHVGKDWTLEHIHAQNAQDLTRTTQWTTWLEEQYSALETIKSISNASEVQILINEIKKAIPAVEERGFGERFRNLAGRVLKVLTPNGEGADHSIANLALLSHGANAELSNAVFEVKRQKVVAMDKRGDYIPVATRNVFLKYYTPADKLQPHFWSEADKAAYLQNIKDKLNPYLQ